MSDRTIRSTSVATPQAKNLDYRRTTHTLSSEARAVGRHSLVYLLGPALSNAIGFLLIPIYTRYIDRSLFGVMSLVDVFMTMFIMILSLGMADGMARFYHGLSSENERRRLVSTVLFAPAVLGLPVILSLVAGAQSISGWLGLADGYANYLRLAIVASWFSMIAELGYAYLRLVYRAKTFVFLTTLQILAAVGLNLWFVMGLKWGIWGIVYSTLITQGVLALFLFVFILNQVRAWPSLQRFRELFRFGVHLVPSIVSLQLTNYLSPLMIRWLVPGDPLFVLAQVGLFATGQKLGVVPNRFVTVPFQSFWRPRRMELLVQDSPEVRHILARICTYSTLLAAQCALLLSVTAKSLLERLVDPSYLDAYRVVPWLALAYVVLGLEHHFATGMLYAKRTQPATWIGLGALAILALINLIFLPRWGMAVAAVATLISVSVRTCLFLWASQRCFPIPFEIGRILKVLAIGSALYLISTQIHADQWGIEMILRAGCGMLLLPVMWFVGMAHADELQAAANAVTRVWPGREFKTEASSPTETTHDKKRSPVG